MRHRLTLDNPALQRTYELILETAGVQWQGIWRTLGPDGSPVRGTHGSSLGHDGVELLDRIRKIIEESDPALAGLPWTFDGPKPPWLVD